MRTRGPPDVCRPTTGIEAVRLAKRSDPISHLAGAVHKARGHIAGGGNFADALEAVLERLNVISIKGVRFAIEQEGVANPHLVLRDSLIGLGEILAAPTCVSSCCPAPVHGPPDGEFRWNAATSGACNDRTADTFVRLCARLPELRNYRRLPATTRARWNDQLGHQTAELPDADACLAAVADAVEAMASP